MGLSLRPSITISAYSTKHKIQNVLPYIDIYDKGAIRDRNVWMVEGDIEKQEDGTVIPFNAIDSSNAATAESSQSRSSFRIEIPNEIKWKHILLKRNGENAALLENNVTYIPCGGLKPYILYEGKFDPYGWLAYTPAPHQTTNKKSTSITMTEPPSIYCMPPCDGINQNGEPKDNTTRTGFSRDWYSAVIVRRRA